MQESFRGQSFYTPLFHTAGIPVRWIDIGAIFLLILLIYQPLLGHIGKQPFLIWDEARLSRNALEMYKDWQWITPTFDGLPDMWNSKPPLLIWLQAFSFKLFGLSETSFRLPSALAALFTTLLLAFVCARYLRSLLVALTSAIVLITSYGYIVYHGARHGDYDAMLCLWTTLLGLSVFAFAEKQKPIYIYFAAVAIAAGILTKGVTIFMMGPGLLIYLLYRRQFFGVFRTKHFYFGMVIVALGMAYYPIREGLNPGYLQAVWENELGGRFLEVNDYHSESFWYYLNNLWVIQYSYWLPFAVMGYIVSNFSKDPRVKVLGVFAGIIALSFFLVISIAQTKLQWYDIPLYPFLAILCAIFIYELFGWLTSSFAPRWVAISAVVLLLIAPYRLIIGRTYQPIGHMDPVFYAMSFYLQDAWKGKIPFQNQVIAFDGYHTQMDFYVEGLWKLGYSLNYTLAEDLTEGQIVAAYQPSMLSRIQEKYTTETVGSHGLVQIFRITAVK